MVEIEIKKMVVDHEKEIALNENPQRKAWRIAG